MTMQIGQTYALSADARPEGVTVTWSSSDENVATVSGAGVVTALDIGSTTITASSGTKSASCTVEVEPTGGYQYDMTVSNYYDNGFNNNNGSIRTANENAAKRLARIFQLKLYSNYYSYTSLADNCKARRHPYESKCPAPEPCYSPEALRQQLWFDQGVGTDTHTKILWSSHLATTNYSSGSESTYHTVVIIPMPHMNHSDNYQFMHELGHQLEAEDHYCADNGYPCSNDNCDICVKELEQERACVMTNETGFTERSDQELFCSECMGIINTHLSGHHLAEE